MISPLVSNLLFLAVAGFLFGSMLYTGWYTTRYEPEAKPGYALIGLGILVSVTVNTWLEFSVDTSSWFLIAVFITYGLVAAGLVLIVRERRQRAKGDKPK